MKSQLKLQARVIPLPDGPDPSGVLDVIALFDQDGNPVDLQNLGGGGVAAGTMIWKGDWAAGNYAAGSVVLHRELLRIFMAQVATNTEPLDVNDENNPWLPLTDWLGT